jgi:hypothetical protein
LADYFISIESMTKTIYFLAILLGILVTNCTAIKSVVQDEACRYPNDSDVTQIFRQASKSKQAFHGDKSVDPILNEKSLRSRILRKLALSIDKLNKKLDDSKVLSELDKVTNKTKAKSKVYTHS